MLVYGCLGREVCRGIFLFTRCPGVRCIGFGNGDWGLLWEAGNGVREDGAYIKAMYPVLILSY